MGHFKSLEIEWDNEAAASGEVRCGRSYGSANGALFQHLHVLDKDASDPRQLHREQGLAGCQRKLLCEPVLEWCQMRVINV